MDYITGPLAALLFESEVRLEEGLALSNCRSSIVKRWVEFQYQDKDAAVYQFAHLIIALFIYCELSFCSSCSPSNQARRPWQSSMILCKA